jgi:hypothetical protein
MNIGIQNQDSQGDLIDHIAMVNEAELKAVHPDDRHAMRISPEFMERFEQILQPKANISPAKRAIFGDYCRLVDQSKQNGEDEFRPPFQRLTSFEDPSFDPFANFQILMLDNLENLGISVMREEALVGRTCALSALSDQNSVKCNLIMVGGGLSTGKAFCAGSIQKTLITGSYKLVSSMTEEVNLDKRAMVIFREEMTESFFTSQNLPFKYELDQTTSICKTSHSISAMNETLLSRVIPRSVGSFADRAHHDFLAFNTRDQEMKEKGEEDPRLAKREAFLADMQFMQFLQQVVETMITVGMLPDVSTSVAWALLSRWKQALAKAGITVSTRKQEVFVKYCRTLTIAYAINIVYRTMLLDHEPFSIRGIMRVGPFLFCTEQICTFAFTQLAELFVKPQTDLVVKVIATHFCGYVNGKKTSNTLFGKPMVLRASDRTDVPDYNYLRLCLATKGKSDHDKLRFLAEAVHKHMIDDKIIISKEVILDILVNLKKTSFSCNVYDRESGDDVIDQTWNPPMLQINDYGITILRAYVDTVYQRKDDDPIRDTITQCFHEFTPEQRYLLGSTMRRRDDELFPHVFETIDALPNKHKEFTTTNPQGPGECTIKGNLDDIFYESFARNFPSVPDDYWPSVLRLFPRKVQQGAGFRSYPGKRMAKAQVDPVVEDAPPPANPVCKKRKREDEESMRRKEEEE